MATLKQRDQKMKKMKFGLFSKAVFICVSLLLLSFSLISAQEENK